MLARLFDVLCFWRSHTVTRSSSSDVVYVDSTGRVVGHRKSVKLERLTRL